MDGSDICARASSSGPQPKIQTRANAAGPIRAEASARARALHERDWSKRRKFDQSDNGKATGGEYRSLNTLLYFILPQYFSLETVPSSTTGTAGGGGGPFTITNSRSGAQMTSSSTHYSGTDAQCADAHTAVNTRRSYAP